MIDVTTPPKLPPRNPDSHKGDFGRVLVIAGSRGMSGAAVLTGSATLRAGAGLVQVAVPMEIQPIVAQANPCYMTAALPQDLRGRFAAAATDDLATLSNWSTVTAVGPGLGQSESMPEMLGGLLERVECPLVIDADGLNALAKLPATRLKDRTKPTLITPHPGEFARLINSSIETVQAHRENLAFEFARTRGVILVLKGHATLVTDGTRMYRNTTGNPGMATGGSGDVLTGVIAALIGQGMEPFDAAVSGVHIHGLAGDIAAESRGPVSLIATDIIDHLGDAFRRT
ncbi:NAD(P)H-hydrate dehydratase [Zavarzinella formosa]|uniref:NAD(P)H-hydrate dehydratase n=1 Tax=Zavarzinella formosa TaxID=360055 RepID=UPI0003007D2F|nr:NAD(P)H-hydrate dehydratase [Zavarzinella formosa]